MSAIFDKRDSKLTLLMQFGCADGTDYTYSTGYVDEDKTGPAVAGIVTAMTTNNTIFANEPTTLKSATLRKVETLEADVKPA